MASANWTFITNSLSAANVARGVSQGFTVPNGGSSFVFGFRSLTNVAGAVMKAGNQSNFYPTGLGEGGQVTGCIQRNGNLGCTVALFVGLQSNNVTANGYFLGFTQDENPSHLVLYKGTLSDGIASLDAGVLATSVGTYAAGTWAHVRLDVIIQPHGDVHLQAFESDLDNFAVTAPTWVAIPGIPEYIDDQLGVNSGSVPFDGGGFIGVGYHTSLLGRYALVDHMTIGRQA